MEVISLLLFPQRVKKVVKVIPKGTLFKVGLCYLKAEKLLCLENYAWSTAADGKQTNASVDMQVRSLKAISKLYQYRCTIC